MVLVTLTKRDEPYQARVISVYTNKQGETMYLTCDEDNFTVSVPAEKIADPGKS